MFAAGRIWWVARTARRVLGGEEFQRYNTAMAIIIESGAIYSIAVLFLIVIPYDKLYRVSLSSVLKMYLARAHGHFVLDHCRRCCNTGCVHHANFDDSSGGISTKLQT